MTGFSISILFSQILSLALLGLGIYVLILFIKFMKIGIKAFEIYINKNKN